MIFAAHGMRKFRLFAGQMDMTSGNLFAKIALFSLPLMLTTVMQLLYSTIDLISVHAWGAGDTSMGAIAANGSLISLIIIVFNNMSLGSNVAIANAKGADDPVRASRVLHTATLFSFITGIFVAIVGFFLSDNLLEMMGTEPQYIPLATQYLQIYFLGLPALMVYNYAARNMNAMGDSQTPFLILFISGLINIAFDFVFVYFWHMDVAGVGLATVIAEIASAVMALCFLFLRKSNYVSLHWKQLRIHRDSLVEIIRIGLPAGLQGFFFSIPNVFVQSKLYTIEPGNLDLSNGAIASGQIESYVFAGIQAVSSACLAFTAANHGALRKDNIKKVWLYSTSLVFIYTFVCDIVILTLYSPMLRLFVSTDAAVEFGRQRLWVVGLAYTLDGLMDTSASALRGMKKSTYPMIVTLLFCTFTRIVFLATLFDLDFFHNVGWLYAVFPISWVLSIIFNVAGLFFFTPRVFHQIDVDLAGKEAKAIAATNA